MTSLIILTASFPYEGGEQFIEEEIKYWEFSGFDKVYLLPLNRVGNTRYYPHNVHILKSDSIFPSKFKYVFRAIIHKVFFREILYISKNRKKKDFIHDCFQALKETSVMLKDKDYIFKCISKTSSQEIVIYSYWNNTNAYASLLLKKDKKVMKVFSRAHGGDLYEERRSRNYMPLKRQFIANYDMIFVLSQKAKDYYQKTYGIKSSFLKVLPLGVSLPKDKEHPKPIESQLNILSISYCIRLKKIDRIIDSLSIFKETNENIQINWTHIGDGPLKEELIAKANALSLKYPSVTTRFLGHLSNHEVHSYLRNNYFDCFLNVSESEGMPVSIMEAMSYGIPAIAPDIGGISSLIQSNNGILLPKGFSNQYLSDALKNIKNNNNLLEMRGNARNWISNNYNSEKNYAEIIKTIKDHTL